MTQTKLLPMPFIQQHYQSDTIALSDDETTISYRELSLAVAERAAHWQTAMPIQRPLVILFIENSINSVVDYLAALSLNYVILLLNPGCSSSTRANYQRVFKPNAIIENGVLSLQNRQQYELDARVSLLLSTSGSTGAGKCVALSRINLESNCKSILDYLPISHNDRTLATLPLSYSYGLSVLHTHLQAGATICFTRFGVFAREFWNTMSERKVTSLSGVPSFYEMLLRLRFTQKQLPELRYFTQAGGKLASTHVKKLAEYAQQNDKEFYVMYGQTEATARMSYLSPDKVLQKPHSIGQAIPGGEFKLNNDANRDESGELFYRGNNVMLGYANSTDDLALFEPVEWLATGDLAYRDNEGDYILTGRIKRMVKIAGERVNLDVVQEAFGLLLNQHKLTASLCVVGQDDKLICVCSEQLGLEPKEILLAQLSQQLAIPKRNIELVDSYVLPLLGNGKVDYASLNEALLVKATSEKL